MATNERRERHSPDLRTIKLQSISAHLPTERRNVAAREALLHRIRCEFAEMPGLSLTLIQASRLFGVAHDACARIFSELAEEGLLRSNPNKGYYGRPNGELQMVTPQRNSTFLGDARPKDGDVLIAAEPHGSGYTVSIVPGLPQTLHKSYNEALAVARRFARFHRLSALWLTHNGTTLTTVSLEESSERTSMWSLVNKRILQWLFFVFAFDLTDILCCM